MIGEDESELSSPLLVNTTTARNAVQVPYSGCTHSFVALWSFQYLPVVVATRVIDTRNDSSCG